MEPRIFKSERNTQIIIDKKFSIKKGDLVEIEYLKDKAEVIVSANVKIANVSVGNFDLKELEDFLSLFFAEEY